MIESRVSTPASFAKTSINFVKAESQKLGFREQIKIAFSVNYNVTHRAFLDQSEDNMIIKICFVNG